MELITTTQNGFRVVSYGAAEAVQTYAPWRPSLEIYRVYLRGRNVGDLMADPVAGYNFVGVGGGAIVPFRTVAEAVKRINTLA